MSSVGPCSGSLTERHNGVDSAGPYSGTYPSEDAEEKPVSSGTVNTACDNEVFVISVIKL